MGSAIIATGPIPPRDVSGYNPRKHGARCDLCPLDGQPYVPPMPPVGKLRLVIVGEGPGRRETLRREPFVGMTGEILNDELQDAKLDRDEAWVTNALLCMGETDQENDRAAECCAPRLLQELAGLPKKAPILTMGKAATRAVLGVKSILLARGFVWTARDLEGSIATAEAAVRKAEKGEKVTDLADAKLRRETLQARHQLAGRTVLPMLHPTFAFVHNESWSPIFHIDLDRAARWIRGELNFDKLADRIERVNTLKELREQRRVYFVTDNPSEIKKAASLLGPDVACDIETESTQPLSPLTVKILCVQMSDGDRTFVIGPWDARIHAEVLSDVFASKREIDFHNGFGFDQPALERPGEGVIIPKDKIHDTLTAHHTFASHYPQRLDHVVSTFLDCSPWKIRFGRRGAEEKGLPPQHMDVNELWHYGAVDAVVTRLAKREMNADLEPERLVYEHDRRRSFLYKQLQINGYPVDRRRRRLLSKMLKRRAAALKGRMRRIARRPYFEPSKLGQVRKVLFTTLRAPMLNPTKTGLASTSNATLEQLRTGTANLSLLEAQGPVDDETKETRVARFAEALLEWRITLKSKNTYCNPPEAPIWLHNGSFKPLGELQVGDLIMGWVRPIGKKNTLQPSQILRMTRRVAPVVRLIMASGRTIKCTADHLWLRGDPRLRTDAYGFWTHPVQGRTLAYVASEPVALPPKLALTAAWLGGIFDGEGSCYRTRLTITQSFSRNPDVCKAIEAALTALGVHYNVQARAIGEGGVGHNYMITGRQTIINFLHWCRPASFLKIVKALHCGMQTEEDEIVDVEPVGDSEVISMTTSTGNYIAWGYASKNCDPIPILKDGRAHYNFKPFGVISGRPASRILSAPRWSKKLPDRVREIYVAEPGYTLVYFDLSQAEMRAAAHLSADENFIAACRGSVHTNNAIILFPDAREKLERDPKGKNCPQHSKGGNPRAACDCGKPFYDIAKNAGFAVSYLAEAKTVFAYLRANGFPVEFGAVSDMLDRLHNAYEGYYRYVDENFEYVQKHGHLRTAIIGRLIWLGFHPEKTAVANTPIQSFVADIMDTRLLDVIVPQLPRGTEMLMHHYDSATFHVKNRHVDRVQKIIDETWKEPVVLKESIVCRQACEFYLPTDVKTGHRWSDFS